MRIIGAIPNKEKCPDDFKSYLESISNHRPTKQEIVNYKLVEKKWK